MRAKADLYIKGEPSRERPAETCPVRHGAGDDDAASAALRAS